MIRLSVLLGAATWSGSNFLCNYSCVNRVLEVCILSLKDFTWYLSKGKSESLGRNDRNTRFAKPVNKQSKRSWQHSVYLFLKKWWPRCPLGGASTLWAKRCFRKSQFEATACIKHGKCLGKRAFVYQNIFKLLAQCTGLKQLLIYLH